MQVSLFIYTLILIIEWPMHWWTNPIIDFYYWLSSWFTDQHFQLAACFIQSYLYILASAIIRLLKGYSHTRRLRKSSFQTSGITNTWGKSGIRWCGGLSLVILCVCVCVNLHFFWLFYFWKKYIDKKKKSEIWHHKNKNIILSYVIWRM